MNTLFTKAAGWFDQFSINYLGKPISLHKSGITVSLQVTVNRRDSVYVSIPESEDNQSILLVLGPEFKDFETSHWWLNLRKVLHYIYFRERRINHEISPQLYSSIQDVKVRNPIFGCKRISRVPQMQWLYENVDYWHKYPPAMSVQIKLPAFGLLCRAVSPEKYFQITKGHWEYRKEHASMQIEIDRQVVHSLLEINNFSDISSSENIRTYRYFENLNHIQKSFEGKLVFQYPDKKRYLLITLPEEVMTITPEDLENGDYSTVLTIDLLER